METEPLIIHKNTIFEKNVLVNENLQVLGVSAYDSVNVVNDLNTHNLNVDGLASLRGNTFSKGNIYIHGKDDNEDNDFTYLKNDGSIQTKRISINSDIPIHHSKLDIQSLSLNRVIQSITEYYNSIIYVNTISNQILYNIDQIKELGFQQFLTNVFHFL